MPRIIRRTAIGMRVCDGVTVNDMGMYKTGRTGQIAYKKRQQIRCKYRFFITRNAIRHTFQFPNELQR